jgi:cell division transport system permease protein
MKRALISFGRIANAGFHNFVRNAWLSTSAVAIMVVTLTIILSSTILNSALTDTVDDIAQQITVSVYLNDEVEESTLGELKGALEANENVVEVNYISKQDALAIFQEQNSDDSTLLEVFALTGADTLPASYEVTVQDLSNIDSIVAVTEDARFAAVVDETSVNETRKESIDNIAKAQDFITIAAIGAAAIFASISILIIFNTIRMAVFTRSDEIEIMKLIGATPRYIRGPFLFEASMYGVVAGVVSTIVVYSVLLGLGPRVKNQLLIEPTIDAFSNNFVLVLIAAVVMGALIGLLSSMFSLARYLRFKSF